MIDKTKTFEPLTTGDPCFFNKIANGCIGESGTVDS